MAKAARRTNSRSSSANSSLTPERCFGKQVGNGVDDLPAVEFGGPASALIDVELLRLVGEGGHQPRLADAALPETQRSRVVLLQLARQRPQIGITDAKRGRGVDAEPRHAGQVFLRSGRAQMGDDVVGSR